MTALQIEYKAKYEAIESQISAENAKLDDIDHELVKSAGFTVDSLSELDDANYQKYLDIYCALPAVNAVEKSLDRLYEAKRVLENEILEKAYKEIPLWVGAALKQGATVEVFKQRMINTLIGRKVNLK
jgi:hypothetical protein